MLPGNGNREQLRGVGGESLVAGKGVLIFYAKDIDGKIKAVIEPKGFYYLKNPTAKFRILGQQRMKKKGVSLIQDYGGEGTDILKCKRSGSGSVLPLEEGRGILLLKTFKHKPDGELKDKLQDYIKKLINKNNFLPHVIDLDELNVGADTVFILTKESCRTKTTNDCCTGGLDTQIQRFFKQWIS
jgi:hypothetical protein